jgi:hypothetical protein
LSTNKNGWTGGNTGTLITVRVGVEDAHTVAKEFAPELSDIDLMSLPNYHIYLKLMVNGAVSRPFSAESVAYDQFNSNHDRDLK